MSKEIWSTRILGVGAAGTVVNGGTLVAGGTAVFAWAGPDAYGGGYTVGTAVIINDLATTLGTVTLVTLAAAGGAPNGTIGTFSGALTANGPGAFTVTDDWIDGGEYVAVIWGTATAASVGNMFVHVTATPGR